MLDVIAKVGAAEQRTLAARAAHEQAAGVVRTLREAIAKTGEELAEAQAAVPVAAAALAQGAADTEFHQVNDRAAALGGRLGALQGQLQPSIQAEQAAAAALAGAAAGERDLRYRARALELLLPATSKVGIALQKAAQALTEHAAAVEDLAASFPVEHRTVFRPAAGGGLARQTLRHLVPPEVRALVREIFEVVMGPLQEHVTQRHEPEALATLERLLAEPFEDAAA